MPQKVRPLIKTLIETNNTVQDSCKELDCYDWSIDILAKSKESPSFGESNYTLDGLDQLIACARSLTEDVRQFASFVQVRNNGLASTFLSYFVKIGKILNL